MHSKLAGPGDAIPSVHVGDYSHRDKSDVPVSQENPAKA